MDEKRNKKKVHVVHTKIIISHKEQVAVANASIRMIFNRL